jgi:alkylation response protein AidB-like acyl-CoA dehydrogenase
MGDVATSRQRLLDDANGIAGFLATQRTADEANGTLTAESVAALQDAGMFRLKLPAELGGEEADPVTQMRVLEALSHANPAAGWCAMVGATAVGLAGAFLPDEAVAVVFAGGRVPRGATVAMPAGKAVPVDGGYRLTGRWPFGSGVRHAEWINAGAMVAVPEGPVRRAMVFPASSAILHDNWQVAGLRGTGSCDFSVDDLFVPEAFTWDPLNDEPRRGGPVFRIRQPGFVANEHAAFAIGVARLAVDSFLTDQAAKRRGFTGSVSSLAARPAVQRMLGETAMKIAAARALADAVNDAAWCAVQDGTRLTARQQGEMRAAAVHCTDVALAAVTAVFRFSGGGAIFESSVLQQCLRDMNAAAQHLMVSDMAYENLGQMILGIPDVNPMR